MQSKRKILLLNENSFLSLRKKDFIMFSYEKTLPETRKISCIYSGKKVKRVFVEAEKEQLRIWRKLFILDEIKIPMY